MAGLLSISGLASGLDIDSIIEKIMAFESRGVNRLQARVTVQETILGAYENFESRLLALRTDFSRLTRKSTFLAKAVSTTDEDVVSASASSSAGRGTFTITVNQLAQTHQIVSQGFLDTESAIGTGTFSLKVGSRQTVDVTVDSSNNTLQGLADAINDADAGATATVINTGDPQGPYVLMITGEDTGAHERIVIDSSLTGGTEPTFGSVASVVEGSKSGTSTITSGGSYTGNTNGTVSYSVGTGGTIGVDTITVDYDDGNGTTGSFIVPAGYTPGDTVGVFGSVELSFSAGTLVAGDTFSTDVTSSTIQSPADALFTLGNSIGGASAISLTSATNKVTDVVKGLTVELHKVSADPVTITIDDDIDSIVGEVTQLVDQYNGFVDLMDEVFYVEQDSDEVGALLGERAAIDMYSEIQRLVTSVAEGVDTNLKSLADIGITVVTDGKLALNSARLQAALEEDIDAVFNVFGTAGQSTDGDVRFLGAGRSTVAYGVSDPGSYAYDVQITQAAERALLVGAQISAPSASSPVVIDSTNSALKISLGSRSTSDLHIAEGAYTSGDALAAEIQNTINADGTFGQDAVTVRYVDDGGGLGHFEFQTDAYGANAHVRLDTGPANTIYSTIGHLEQTEDYGVDVAGTINGEAATGVGRTLTGDEGNAYTDGLQLLVTISAAELAIQGAAQGSVTVTKGVATRQGDAISRMTDVDNGNVRIRKDAINDGIESLQASIERLEARLEKRRERLVAEFLAMESALADLQNQQAMLQQGLLGLAATTSQVLGE